MGNLFHAKYHRLESTEMKNGGQLTSSGEAIGEGNVQMDRGHLWYSCCPSFVC